MASLTDTVSPTSSSVSKLFIAHVATEVLLIGGLSFYFNKRLGDLQSLNENLHKEIISLTSRIDELETTIGEINIANETVMTAEKYAELQKFRQTTLEFQNFAGHHLKSIYSIIENYTKQSEEKQLEDEKVSESSYSQSKHVTFANPTRKSPPTHSSQAPKSTQRPSQPSAPKLQRTTPVPNQTPQSKPIKTLTSPVPNGGVFINPRIPSTRPKIPAPITVEDEEEENQETDDQLDSELEEEMASRKQDLAGDCFDDIDTDAYEQINIPDISEHKEFSSVTPLSALISTPLSTPLSSIPEISEPEEEELAPVVEEPVIKMEVSKPKAKKPPTKKKVIKAS